MQPTRNLGLFAHVDAGKTTLTEQLLFAAGAIRRAGSVDQGSAVSDALEVERRRGISVRLATTSLSWEGVRLNLIDTPGHADFSAEVERALAALDGAVLVLSAVEGVQAGSEAIWRALVEAGVPTLIFINKLDRVGADPEGVLQAVRRDLCPQAVPLQRVAGGQLAPLWSAEGQDASLIEAVVETDEALLDPYLADEPLSWEALDQGLAAAVRRGALTPVLFGVAKDAVGIAPLLDAAVRYLPAPAGDPEAPLSGVVYKVEHHPRLGLVAWVRLHAGRLAVRDPVPNTRTGLAEKAAQLKRAVGSRLEDVEAAEAGEVVAVCGLSAARVGDRLGTGEGVRPTPSLGAPLLAVEAVPQQPAGFSALAEALAVLHREDPDLCLERVAEPPALHLRVRGPIQVEVLEALLAERFGLSASFSPPAVVYRETPAGRGTGHERYWMPKPCWAVMTLRVEPGPPGSGLVYRSEVGVDAIARRFQNEIERTLPAALRQGPRGWEVTDLQLTLVEGEDHQVHSHPGDFIVATPMAVMNGLLDAGTTLLEPILAFHLTAPEEHLGALVSELIVRRGEVESPVFERGKVTLSGAVPAATSLDLPVTVASKTGGKGQLRTSLLRWSPAPAGEEHSAPFRGISPTERDRYILHARKAL
ncbi:MAG: TetM/TetW/TetO/TetS family tetracycline resistance ribosomal protection protein [Deltaproteobacteria bacterium]|nr:TetM/TetW/TetO/TetS family tetracycline resistance ribosomal protection protein [Deltaproteobacteria bacterium]